MAKCPQCNGTGLVYVSAIGHPTYPVICPSCTPSETSGPPRLPDIDNEVLTVVWSTVRATGETMLRVMFNLKFGSWTVSMGGKNGTDFLCDRSPQGWPGFVAHTKSYAVSRAIEIMGGWK